MANYVCMYEGGISSSGIELCQLSIDFTVNVKLKTLTSTRFASSWFSLVVNVNKTHIKYFFP